MDIKYLLALQNFRQITADILTPFMDLVSLFIVSFIPLAVCLVIYWMYDRRMGRFLLMNFVGGKFINATLKLNFCVYRPWIRDARIIPAKNVIKTAGGYSFPSGHTTNATAYYGSAIRLTWKKRKGFVIFCVIMILLTAFSRNYLGVHTPQDVIVGFLVTALVIIANEKLLCQVEKNSERELVLLICGIVFAVAVLVFISVKSYPIDYVNQTLLVNPDKMKMGAYNSIGSFCGLLLGCYTERSFIKYENSSTKKPNAKIKITVAVALILAYLIFRCGGKIFSIFFEAEVSRFLAGFIMYFYCMAIVPLFIKCVVAPKF